MLHKYVCTPNPYRVKSCHVMSHHIIRVLLDYDILDYSRIIGYCYTLLYL